MAPKEAFRLEFSYNSCAAGFIVSRNFANPSEPVTPLLRGLCYRNEGHP